MIRIVYGEDIRHWYNEKNHSKTIWRGGLHWSSMKHVHMQPYFDLYTKNRNIGLLISTCIDEDSVERLMGRALVWYTENGQYVVDNMYADEDTSWEMIRYIVNNGFRWLPMTYQAYKVRLDNAVHETYPYVDTFQWMGKDEEGWFLQNYPSSEAQYRLSSHKGLVFYHVE